MRSKIVVTGGAGFIGRNIVAALNARGQSDIVIVDDLGTDDKWMNLRGLEIDTVVNIDDLGEYLDSPEADKIAAIIHMGACSATTERDADYLLSNNYQYTVDLVSWSRARGVRMIYASSGATYGDGSLGYSDDDAVTPTLKPLNMYGFSKHMTDLWALRTGALDEVVGVKFFNVYGPYEEHKDDMRSLVSKAYVQVRDTGTMRLFRSYHPDYADGESLRDFVYVDDAVEVILFFLDNPQVNGLFNCGTSRATSWIELANAVFKASGVEPNIEFIDMPESIRDRYQYFTQADGAKLRAAGFTGTFRGVEDGVKAYVDTYLAKELAP